jgi:hypothetical protein
MIDLMLESFPALRPSLLLLAGAATGGDPGAWDDSIREVAAFFGRHL